MTLDLTVAPADLSSTLRRQVALYTGPSSYATGGDAMTPNDVRMGKVFAILGLVISNGTTVYLGFWNPTTQKILFYDGAFNEVGAATNLSTFTGTFEFIGV